MTWLLWLVDPALAAPVSLTTADGVKLSAEDYGAGHRAVLLVHDEARSRTDFSTLAPRLAAAGYHVLAIDLRGHGSSTVAQPLAEADWPKLVGDVQAGVGWLHDHGATELHVVGVGLGANLALNAAVSSPAVSDLILLSPALNVHGVRVATAIGPLGARPLMVVSSSDALSLKTATWLETQAVGPAVLATYPGTDRGTGILQTAPDLENRIVSWLASSGQAAGPAATIPSKSGELKTGVTAIETTGVRLEDRHR